MMAEIKNKTLFGFPVVITDAVPQGEIVCGRFPTPEEIREHGSYEKAIQAQAREWTIIKGIAVDDGDAPAPPTTEDQP